MLIICYVYSDGNCRMCWILERILASTAVINVLLSMASEIPILFECTTLSVFMLAKIHPIFGTLILFRSYSEGSCSATSAIDEYGFSVSLITVSSAHNS